MSRLIDADALIALVMKRLKNPVIIGWLCRLIDEAPTIEAEPVRHGRWEKRGQEIYCSECGEESGYTWAGASRYSDYCPDCGAKMDKGE